MSSSIAPKTCWFNIHLFAHGLFTLLFNPTWCKMTPNLWDCLILGYQTRGSCKSSPHCCTSLFLPMSIDFSCVTRVNKLHINSTQEFHSWRIAMWADSKPSQACVHVAAHLTAVCANLMKLTKTFFLFQEWIKLFQTARQLSASHTRAQWEALGCRSGILPCKIVRRESEMPCSRPRSVSVEKA